MTRDIRVLAFPWNRSQQPGKRRSAGGGPRTPHCTAPGASPDHLQHQPIDPALLSARSLNAVPARGSQEYGYGLALREQLQRLGLIVGRGFQVRAAASDVR